VNPESEKEKIILHVIDSCAGRIMTHTPVVACASPFVLPTRVLNK
jgi:hypothetical protein